MIQNVQALRFYAALAVMLFHVSSIYNHYKGEMFAPWAAAFDPLGRAGVDVFFVISGFVIWTSTAQRHAPVDALPFALRRVARILITYWPALIFAVLVDILIRKRDLLNFDVFRSITLLPPEFGRAGPLLLPVSWTLTFEMIFYLSFAAMMLLPRKLTLPVMLAWGALSLVAPGGTLLSPFIAEFAAGCLLGYVVSRIRTDQIPTTALAGLAIALLIGGLHGDGQWARVVWFGSFGAAVVLIAVGLEGRGLIASRWLVTMGGASYALYLFHFPILQAVGSFWPTLKVFPELVLIVIPLSLLASLLWWVLFEEKANSRAKAFVDTRFRKRMRGSDAIATSPPAPIIAGSKRVSEPSA